MKISENVLFVVLSCCNSCFSILSSHFHYHRDDDHKNNNKYTKLHQKFTNNMTKIILNKIILYIFLHFPITTFFIVFLKMSVSKIFNIINFNTFISIYKPRTWQSTLFFTSHFTRFSSEQTNRHTSIHISLWLKTSGYMYTMPLSFTLNLQYDLSWWTSIPFRWEFKKEYN